MQIKVQRQEQPQLATVAVSSQGVTVRPEHVSVNVGGIVDWRIAVAGNMPPLLATLSFRNGSPFDWTSRDVIVDSHESGIAVAAKPRKKGDFKYGVRVVEKTSGRMIGEDDPLLDDHRS